VLLLLAFGFRISAETPCWTGHFTGTDTSGYAMDVRLTERNGTVEGGYSYLHEAHGKQVRAILLDARMDGDMLSGRWKQVEGIPAEGRFQWHWLPGERCKAFEGSFNGTKFWNRISRVDSIPPPPPPPIQLCWTGHFTGTDTSGYAMDVRLKERNGVVEGGYSYFHKAQGKQVRAVILDARMDGEVLAGRWKQVEGILAEGQFQWRWLPGQRCKTFEGSFNGTKFWNRIGRVDPIPPPPPPPPPPPTIRSCWAGHFTGTDTTGYAMDVRLTEHNGVVEGGYSYFHKAQGKHVRAVILDARMDGEVLSGRWKQVEGIPAEGQFKWRWLQGQRCKVFEGSFNGIKFWRRISRR
jgi:hypothetical protein